MCHLECVSTLVAMELVTVAFSKVCRSIIMLFSRFIECQECLKVVFVQLQRLGHKMVVGMKRKDAKQANGNSTAIPNDVVRSPSVAAAQCAQRQKLKKQREGLVLWKRPITTTEYFIKEVSTLLYTYGEKYVTQNENS